MAFMKPETSYFTADEAAEWQSEAFDGGEYDRPEAGWYGRLSASGYLDCTDWSGPFATHTEALAHVLYFYEVDENGDSPEENAPGMVVGGVDEYGSVD